MSALDERWADIDPEKLAGGALVAPRCKCREPLVDGHLDCLICGREFRLPGTLAREFRVAAYQRRLSWAAGMGLARRTGFQGLSYQLGPNPPLPALDAALGARIEQTVGDPTHRVDGV